MYKCERAHPAKRWRSLQDVPLPPTKVLSSDSAPCTHPCVHATLFLPRLIQNDYFERQGYFYYSVSRSWQLFQIFFMSWFNASALGARGQLGRWGGPKSLVNPRVCCKQTLGQNQDRWPSKTTGMQSLHLAPHTEQKQNRNIDGNWPEDQAKEWNWNIEPTWTSFYYWGYDKNLRVSAHAAMFSLCYTMHKSSLLSLLFSLQGVALGLSYTGII